MQIVGDIRSRDVHNQIWEIMNGEKFDLIISDIHPGRSSSSGMDHKFWFRVIKARRIIVCCPSGQGHYSIFSLFMYET